MTTVEQLIDRARSFDRDDAGSFVTPQDYINWLNEAQTDLAAREQLFEQQASAVTDGTNSVQFPTDPALLEIQSVRLGDDDYVNFVDYQYFDTLVVSGAVPTDTIARVYDDHIQFYPTPDDLTDVTIRYKRLPVVLENGEDTIEIPAQLERKALEYMKAQACFKDNEFERGNNWLSLYESGLGHPSTAREKFYTRPVAMTRRPNTFDLQPGARHI